MARLGLHSSECFGRLTTQSDNRSAIGLALDIEALSREAGLFGERLVRVGQRDEIITQQLKTDHLCESIA
jgi:hypothetical protein